MRTAEDKYSQLGVCYRAENEAWELDLEGRRKHEDCLAMSQVSMAYGFPGNCNVILANSFLDQISMPFFITSY